MIRWWYLVLALEVPLRLRDALRIGFWGYLFNLAPLGIVGGDLLKAWMLAREQGQRAKALASVVVDRMIGLYMLFVVASTAIMLTGIWKLSIPDIRWTCQATFIVTVAGAVAIAMLLAPGLTDGKGARALVRLPRVGPAIESLFEAVRMYRRKPHVLLAASVMSVGVHSLFAVGVFLIALGLPGGDLSMGTHFVVMPLSASAGILPLPMGPFEFVLEFLYTHIPGEVVIPAGQGLVVALAYRLITILIAAVGFCVYSGSRREVAQVMHEAEQQSPVEPHSQTEAAQGCSGAAP
jgi:uncharacterized membrane protein YbhN (UPF0104 family)